MPSLSLQTARRILTNTAALTAAKTIADLAIFLFLVYFARAFGPSVLGKYSFAMSVGGLISILISLGFHTVMLRDAVREPAAEAKFTGNLFVVECALATVVAGLLFVMVAVLGVDNDMKLIVLLIGSYHIASRLCGLFDVRFRIHEEMHFSALLLVFEKLLILAFGIYAILTLNDPVMTLAVYPLAATATLFLIITVTTRRYGFSGFELDPAFIRHAFVSSIPFIVLIAIGQAIDRGGVILLAFLTDAHAVGIYAAADRLLVTIVAGIVIFGAALFPVMSRLQLESRNELRQVYNGALRTLSLLVMPAATLLFLFGEPIIALLFGSGFSASADIFLALSLSLPLIAVNQISGVLLMATLKHGSLIRVTTVSLITLMISGMALVPSFGAIGLAVAKLVSSLFTALLVYRLVAKQQLTLSTIRSAAASLLACLATGGAFFLWMNESSLWFTAPAAVTLLFLFLFMFGAVQRQDMGYVRKLLVHANSR